EQGNDQSISSNGDIFRLDQMKPSGKPWSIDYGINWEAKLLAEKNGDDSWILRDIVSNPNQFSDSSSVPSGSSNGYNT
ncbi:MAG: hypothetical protein WCD53_19305, partial [Microcoleus sp.]